MTLKPLACALLSATLITQLSACGTIFYPERRGQLSGEIDAGVAILNGIGLLFYIVPGLIAFGVDFATGAIYLPDRRYSVAPERLDQAVDEHGNVDPLKLKAIIREELQLDLPLEHARQIDRPAAEQLAALGLAARA
ncbi:polyribonucleotide nucleotidyltransferase [Halopseudomonas nanhaiensis]|uniref:polyribonucleotide nucleotidyltransferase n=1 Tax=Halopseudomonas nanhaiensis TaxID=2830842 RepID=UPI001CBEC36C|nr:polyribonucleotide nucleotidyltransferase [Halopseudomonas nanhaiensis]UAW99205.1 polyribonucleotide nucleotidyltransferase [Halopseudomonas nanhaiensis]